MSWQGIHGHDVIVERFREANRQDRLAGAYLFVGPAGVGKRTFALKLAAALLCENTADDQFQPCQRCSACKQVAAGTHPDLELIRRPKDKSVIPVELFIGDREHRMREGLCHAIALKPFCGGRKVAIIDDADFLNQEGANCLLKTLEEPPPRSVIILIGTSEQKQLPTIRSRCQIVRFQPLDESVMVQLLRSLEWVDSDQQAQQLAALAGGSLASAANLADEGLREFRDTLLRQLGDPDVADNEFAQQLSRFVDEAGKEAAKRRRRLETVVDLAIDFYQGLLRAVVGGPEVDPAMQTYVKQAAADERFSPQRVTDCLERCLEARDQIYGNANQATLIECWLDDLSQIGLGLASPIA